MNRDQATRLFDYAFAFGSVEGVVSMNQRGYLSDIAAIERIKEIIAEHKAKENTEDAQ